ncbi:hypothetical protein [Paracandidimonas soli]|uniref:Uncharacterized protein n=1 Tax=Paracandidimonas soli TaxID=1917182 RepID=A0A4R3UWX6_9BURK|nr:hypothetical protein [Paracandidimonas soli]TCU95293.1 hypothetical protein EV686_108136 [Paracandidimonas soli]
MTLLNGQVHDVLKQVRLRQVPWHKKQNIFRKLHARGLVLCVPQVTISAPDRTAVDIALLTESGQAELERLAHCQRGQAWLTDTEEPPPVSRMSA